MHGSKTLAEKMKRSPNEWANKKLIKIFQHSERFCKSEECECT